MNTAGTSRWTQDEIDDAHALVWDVFKLKNPHRTQEAYHTKRKRSEPSTVIRAYTSDKAVGDFDWRDANRVLAQMQGMATAAQDSQDFAEIVFNVDHPIAVLCLSDTHIGDWATDHELFERVTDEILETPNLYIALLGDLTQMAIKLRSVGEMSSNALTPEMQMKYLESWLGEVQHRILFSTFDNHAVEREEAAVGFSRYAELMKRRVIYHAGIGQPTIRVGDQTYKLAVSHAFRGKSVTNPCHGGMLYLTREGHDRQIALMGDTHVPGIMRFMHGNVPKLAINAGTMQLGSLYARRWFSLFSAAVFPVFTLDPEDHQFAAYWSLAEWKRATQRGN